MAPPDAVTPEDANNEVGAINDQVNGSRNGRPFRASTQKVGAGVAHWGGAAQHHWDSCRGGRSLGHVGCSVGNERWRLSSHFATASIHRPRGGGTTNPLNACAPSNDDIRCSHVDDYVIHDNFDNDDEHYIFDHVYFDHDDGSEGDVTATTVNYDHNYNDDFDYDDDHKPAYGNCHGNLSCGCRSLQLREGLRTTRL